MKFFMLIFVAVFLKLVVAEVQLVGWKGSPVSVILNAESLKKTGEWNCVQERTDEDINSNITSRRSPVTNVTIARNGIYSCVFSSRNKRLKETIQVELYDALPLTQLAGPLLYDLRHLQYSCLILCHRYYASNNYLPNVAKFFRSYMEKTANMIDQVVKYILAKQVTTSALDGSCPPDYLEELFDSEYAMKVPINLEDTAHLNDSFYAIFKQEKLIVRSLADIGVKARDIDDAELEEFIYADLIPQLMKTMKKLTDYRTTVQSIAKKDRRLGEFIFDRKFSP